MKVKAVRAMLLIPGILLAGLLLFAVTVAVRSTGKPDPLTDADGTVSEGSISEKIHVEINGMKQGMFIKGRNADNPVLLYLHGGLPDYFLTETYPTGLEEVFTVVWWEQRGSGISWNADISPDTMNLEQMISDTLEVTQYLRGRFHKEKIYIMGHSGGTFIGIHAAARAPELYLAYLGVAQMSNQLESEARAHAYMLGEFARRGNGGMVRKLQAAPVATEGGASASWLAIRDRAMHELGIGTARDIHSILTGIFLPSLFFREYTFMEKVNLWRGKAGSGISILWNEMLATDLSVKVPSLDIPVYFFEGIYDYTCSYTGALSYFERLQAPLKGFYTFEKSAHSPLFEEPEKMRSILREDVLQGKNELAD